ncbi:glycosyl transferase [Gorgonomyces haynaldii]|nr:glycosyl transferase [Gorgonomyces haynaldii]
MLVVALIAIKVLLFPSYSSTDFEVHRNWLAITQGPLDSWYYENTSQWTLDYPPFFAWFEYLLSLVARFVDPQMLVISKQSYFNTHTLYFQRWTVLVTELVYYYGCWRASRHLKHANIIFVLLVCSPGIFIVDNIHFQYNGFMYGLQLLGIECFFSKRYLLGGLLFAVVLNFKHIYLYQAPAYFVFLLAGYCWKEGLVIGLVKMGLTVLSVFAVSLGPFYKHLPQLFGRMFDFKRGLCHAYWAPNVWALYSFLDRVLIQVYTRLGHELQSTAHLTRGLVGDVEFAVLPQIAPFIATLLTILTQLPILVKLWYKPQTPVFIDALVLSSFSSYLFSWHVHEKAILLVLIPISFTALRSKEHANIFMILSTSGYFSLFPLLFEPQELVTKAGILLIYYLASQSLIENQLGTLKLMWIERLYLLGFVPLFLVTEVLLPLYLPQLAFLPLMLTSVYCALGVVSSWLRFYLKAMT